MKSLILMFVLLLSGCAIFQPSDGAPGTSGGAVKEQRKGDAKPQSAVRQSPAPAEAEQPPRSIPEAQPPLKRKHNVEED